MPINRKHPIAELLDACWQYVNKQNARSITFEYVMLDGVNDQPEHAHELVQLLQGPAGESEPDPVQSVPGNALSSARARRRSNASATSSTHNGVIATTRRTRGDDIDAACGQLVGRVHDRTTVRLGSKLISVAVQS